MNYSQSKLHHWVFGVVSLVLVGFYVHRNWGFAHDDSYITFRYAENWMNGLGLRFNPSEVYYGTTAAGYAVVLALISSIFSYSSSLINPNLSPYFSIPNVAVMLSGISVLVISWVTYLMTAGLEQSQRLIIGLLGSVCLFSSYLFENSAGHETNLFIATLGGSIYWVFSSKRFALGAVGLFLATTFRPDAIITVGIVISALYFLKVRGFGTGWRRVLFVYAVLLVFWLIFVKINLGAFLPGTMLAKKAQVAIGHWSLFDLQQSGIGIFEYLSLRGLVFVVTGIIAWLGCVGPGLNKFKLVDYQICLIVFFAGQLGSYLGYLLLNVTYWSWYGIPPALGLLALGAVGWLTLLNQIHSSPQRKEIKSFFYVLIAILGGALVYPEIISSYDWATGRHSNPHLAVYDDVVEFIKKDAPSGAVIQMNEPGKFGFALGPKYKINDELGLVTPGVAEALVNGNYRYLFRKETPDYLVCSWGGKYTLCRSRKLKKQYRLVGEFHSDFWKTTYVKSGVRVYKRVAM